jgi:hypothetical protein
MRQIHLGSVHNLLAGLVATRYANGLRAVVGLLTTGASGFAGLGAASVLGLRQLVGGVIDDIPLGTSGRSGDLKTHKALRENDDGDQQQALQQPADEHAAIWEHANGRFSGQALRRASERGA